LNASINAAAFPFHRQACEAAASTRWDIPAEPNADESGERHEREKSIHGDQNPGRDARHVDSRWRHAGIEMAPYRCAETEGACVRFAPKADK
jgi:hypothetical protein